MENLQNILDFAKRYFTVEMLIMVILIIGTFLVFSFFIQDLLQDYFRDYRDKKKRDLEAGITPEKKPKPRKPKIKSRPRLVKKARDSEPPKKKKPRESREMAKGKK